MAATASNPPSLLDGHAHQFQHPEPEGTDEAEDMATDISPSDILKQLNAAEATSSFLLSPSALGAPEETSNFSAPPPPPAYEAGDAVLPAVANQQQQQGGGGGEQQQPRGQVEEEEVQNDGSPEADASEQVVPAVVEEEEEEKEEAEQQQQPPPPEFRVLQDIADGAESVEISHVSESVQPERAPPSPVPVLLEEPEERGGGDGEDGIVEEPFDCMPVDDSEEAILRRLERVVQDSDRVLRPDRNGGVVGGGRSRKNRAGTARSGDRTTAHAGMAATSSQPSRPNFKMMGKVSKPKQPIMQLRVNDYTYEPIEAVKNQQDDVPFDETAGHNLKSVLRSMFACSTKDTTAANNGLASTPDTTLTEAYASDEDDDGEEDTTTLGLDDEDDIDDEWTADTSKNTADASDGAVVGNKKAARAMRRQVRLAQSRALEEKSKEQAGVDEWFLDTVFSPKATERALVVADLLQQGAEATSNKAKELLKGSIEHLEQEEAAIDNNGTMVHAGGEGAATGTDAKDGGVEDGDDQDSTTPTDVYQSIAEAITHPSSETAPLDEEQQDAANPTTDATITEDRQGRVADPWDQPKESYDKVRGEEEEGEEDNFTDLLKKGFPLVNRKFGRMVNQWKAVTEAAPSDEAGGAKAVVAQQQEQGREQEQPEQQPKEQQEQQPAEEPNAPEERDNAVASDQPAPATISQDAEDRVSAAPAPATISQDAEDRVSAAPAADSATTAADAGTNPDNEPTQEEAAVPTEPADEDPIEAKEEGGKKDGEEEEAEAAKPDPPEESAADAAGVDASHPWDNVIARMELEDPPTAEEEALPAGAKGDDGVP